MSLATIVLGKIINLHIIIITYVIACIPCSIKYKFVLLLFWFWLIVHTKRIITIEFIGICVHLDFWGFWPSFNAIHLLLDAVFAKKIHNANTARQSLKLLIIIIMKFSFSSLQIEVGSCILFLFDSNHPKPKIMAHIRGEAFSCLATNIKLKAFLSFKVFFFYRSESIKLQSNVVVESSLSRPTYVYRKCSLFLQPFDRITGEK